MSRYDDIKHLTRPQYDDLPPMPRHDRAAQFSPFAALVGYDDAVAESERLTSSRREMMEDEILELNDRLAELAERLHEGPPVTVTYFVEDGLKEGGSYEEKTGVVRLIDQYNGVLVFTDGGRIPIRDLYGLRIGV